LTIFICVCLTNYEAVAIIPEKASKMLPWVKANTNKGSCGW